MRLMRLLSLLKSIKQLRVIVVGLIQGCRSSIYVLLLLVIIIYVFAVVAVNWFGANDPGNFGTVTIAMMTLFQVTTLSSWSGISYISIFGCDEYGDGLYDWMAQNSSVKAQEYKQTMLGSFPRFDCIAPKATHSGIVQAFYIIYTTITALVILSLLVGAIAMAMFTAFSNVSAKLLIIFVAVVLNGIILTEMNMKMEMKDMFDSKKHKNLMKDDISPFYDLGRKVC